MAFLIDSYSESNVDAYWWLSSDDQHGEGQSFTGASGVLNSCKWYLKKTGLPTGNMVAKVYTHSGTFGASSEPTGTALGTSGDFNVATLTTSSQLITFTFSGVNKITLDNGTKYVVTIEYTGGDTDNYVMFGTDESSPTHTGNASYTMDGTNWTPYPAGDDSFYVFIDNTPKSHTIDAIIYEAGAKTITSDALIQDTFISSHTADAYLVSKLSATYTVDTIITATDFWKVGTKNDITTTLDGGITATTNSIDLVSATGLQAPGIVAIGLVNSEGTLRTDEAEHVSFGGITDNTLTSCSRGVGGSTARAHNSGEDVREVWTNTHWNDFVTLWLKEHGMDGKHTKGVQTLDYSSYVNIDPSLGGVFELTLNGNPTLALMNDSVGQTFVLRLIQGAGGNTVTWWSGIKWEDNVAPTLTATAGKTDVFSFVVISEGNYDGFISGQNL